MKSGRSLRSTTRMAVGMAALMAVLLGTVFAAPTQAASTTAKKTFTNTTAVPVPDGSGGSGEFGQAASSIEVSGLTGSITKVTASVYLTHGRTSDLDAAIIPPEPGPNFEVFAYLFTPLSSNGASFGTSCADADRTTFDDAAATAIDQATSPFVGVYQPMAAPGKPLSILNGNAGGLNGTWSFDVIDGVPGETGTIECWSLFIDTDADEHVRFDSTAPVPLEDATAGSGVASSPITATGLTSSVTSVKVSVWISHPNVGDLDVVLVSPSGTELTLAAGVGGTGDNFGSSCSKPTTFDDAAKTSIASGSAPFAGSFVPMTNLGSLTNEVANGQWQLRVTDSAPNNVGTINCWSLIVESGAATPPPPAGLVVQANSSAPAPLPGTYDYVYVSIRNNLPDPVANVSLSMTLPSALTDAREEPVAFPNCDVAGSQVTCTWAQLDPGQAVFGGAIAKVDIKKGKICVSGSVTATGVSPLTASACVAVGAYPKNDRGTGYGVGAIAHDLALPDQNGDQVSLSDFAGKYVLLQFTSAWCPPSNFEVPQDRDEVAALNDSNAMGVEVVYLTVMLDGPTVSVASTKQNAINWTTKFQLTTPVLWTANDANKTAIQQHLSYNIVEGQTQAGVPTSVFIRPDGTIFGVRVGAEESGATTARFMADL